MVEREVPAPGPGEVRVRVAAAGICLSDRELYEGRRAPGYVRYPIVPGHEWSGTADAVGTGVDPALLGRPCVAEGFRSCGGCERCRYGEISLCTAALGHWDVAHGRWTVEPGAYELQAGASSADVRRTVRVEVAGEAPGPRPVLAAGLAAADYDEQSGTVLVDRAKTSGDAVAPADPGVPGVLLYRACAFCDGVTEIAVTASVTGEVTFFAADGTTPPWPVSSWDRRTARTPTPPSRRPATSEV
ncbi:hypothetical protein DEJ44_31135 [Streptomyces venezuelae]|nr:hypothetical protein DEJ44_31135 [Streptomyces venezuelae]